MADDQPAIEIDFRPLTNLAGLTLTLDDSDVTGLVQISESRLQFKPLLSLSNGDHEVTVAMGASSERWKFVVTHTRLEPEAAPQIANSDAEVVGPPAKVSPPEQVKDHFRPETRTHFGFDPQLASGGPKSLALSGAQQTIFQNGPWRLEENGSGLVNALLSPQPRHLLGQFNDYVARISYDQKAWGGTMRFGIMAPSIYSEAEFITSAVAREGVEPSLRTPAGTATFYANTRDLNLGGGDASTFHQQILGAGYQLPLPAKFATMRFLWLTARDVGSAAALVLNSSGPASVINPLATAAASDEYGGLLQIHLGANWGWNSEYAFSRTNSDVTRAGSQRLFGRAWRSGVSGSWKKTEVQVSYRDVSPNFGSPANPALTALSSPDRRGINISLKQGTVAGNFMAGYQYMQSEVSRADRPPLSLHNLTGGWAKNLARATVFSVEGHETRSFTGTLPPAVQSLDPQQFSAFRADQRNLGGRVVLTHQSGPLILSAMGARDWMRNRVLQGQNATTSSLQFGATWRARSFFQLQSNLGVNWVAREKQSIGGLRFLTVYIQPMVSWRRTGLSIAPLATIGQTQGSLASGVLTQDALVSQMGGRLSWQLPGRFRFAALSVEGLRLHTHNGLNTPTPPAGDITDKRLVFLLPLVRDF